MCFWVYNLWSRGNLVDFVMILTAIQLYSSPPWRNPQKLYIVSIYHTTFPHYEIGHTLLNSNFTSIFISFLLSFFTFCFFIFSSSKISHITHPHLNSNIPPHAFNNNILQQIDHNLTEPVSVQFAGNPSLPAPTAK